MPGPLRSTGYERPITSAEPVGSAARPGGGRGFVHILIVNRHIDDIAGGSETQCDEIAAALVDRGHTVTYGVCRPGPAVHAPAHPYAVYPLRGPFRRAFRRALRDVGPEIIYWRYNKRHLLAGVLEARRAGIKLVFAVSHINDLKPFAVKPFHGAHLGPARRILRAAGRLKMSVRSAINHAALLLVDGIVFQHAGQIPPRVAAKHVVIHNSIAKQRRAQTPPPAYAPADATAYAQADATAYAQADATATVRPGAPPPPARRPGQAAPTSDASQPYVLWAANLKQSKNPEEFVRLAAELAHTGIGFRMAGAVQDAAYRRMLRAVNLPPEFRYVGHQPRDALDALMARCLFLVHTCSPEGFPNVFLHAWSHGKPVVSLHFDPGSLLRLHRIGFCSDGDRAVFRRTVERLVHDADLRCAIGSRARAFVQEHCDRDRNAARLDEFLAGILAAERR